MPDFLGGYVIFFETVIPFVQAYYFKPSPDDPNVFITPTSPQIMRGLNLIGSKKNKTRKFPPGCVKGIGRKRHDPVLFFPTHLDASVDEKYMVPESDQDKKFLEEWLTPFIEKCPPEIVQNFREKTKFGTVRLPIGKYQLSEPDDA
ncbi:hypothetical protein VKT23_017738 [Stygiomarasmius scandens]|uniref:Uncharacterized protein n=1 Tax=Marasmiellus scandens TaxID=2682957 RepID=A0ABR1ITL0_9AGAR